MLGFCQISFFIVRFSKDCHTFIFNSSKGSLFEFLFSFQVVDRSIASGARGQNGPDAQCHVGVGVPNPVPEGWTHPQAQMGNPVMI